jgi:hypothetical protein
MKTYGYYCPFDYVEPGDYCLVLANNAPSIVYVSSVQSWKPETIPEGVEIKPILQVLDVEQMERVEARIKKSLDI